jgi:hypothetical protein
MPRIDAPPIVADDRLVSRVHVGTDRVAGMDDERCPVGVHHFPGKSYLPISVLVDLIRPVDTGVCLCDLAEKEFRLPARSLPGQRVSIFSEPPVMRFTIAFGIGYALASKSPAVPDGDFSLDGAGHQTAPGLGKKQ